MFVTLLYRARQVLTAGFPMLQARLRSWTKPPSPSFTVGCISDLARSKRQLVIENALLRQQLVVLQLSEHRDMNGATAFFDQAIKTTGDAPDRVTTDGHDSSPRAIRQTLGEDVTHRCSPYLNNRLEQDHRGGCPLGEATRLPHARLWKWRCGRTLLSRL